MEKKGAKKFTKEDAQQILKFMREPTEIIAFNSDFDTKCLRNQFELLNIKNNATRYFIPKVTCTQKLYTSVLDDPVTLFECARKGFDINVEEFKAGNAIDDAKVNLIVYRKYYR